VTREGRVMALFAAGHVQTHAAQQRGTISSHRRCERARLGKRRALCFRGIEINYQSYLCSVPAPAHRLASHP
jgi:hypothetical protein